MESVSFHPATPMVLFFVKGEFYCPCVFFRLVHITSPLTYKALEGIASHRGSARRSWGIGAIRQRFSFAFTLVPRLLIHFTGNYFNLKTHKLFLSSCCRCSQTKPSTTSNLSSVRCRRSTRRHRINAREWRSTTCWRERSRSCRREKTPPRECRGVDVGVCNYFIWEIK